MMLSELGSGIRRGRDLRRRESMIGGVLLLAFALLGPPSSFAQGSGDEFYDSHFHLANFKLGMPESILSDQAYDHVFSIPGT